MSDGCQNYDKGLGETRDREGWDEGPAGIAERVEVKYKDIIPKCQNPFLRNNATCATTFTDDALQHYCKACKQAKELREVLKNYETLKLKSNDFLMLIKGQPIEPKLGATNLYNELCYLSTEYK